MVRNQLRWGIGTLAIGALLALPVAAAAADRQVTFSKDVAPILQAKCQSCHEPGSIAPMSLRTYPGGTAVGEVDQATASRSARCRRGTSTQRRHSEIQERHVAERRADRHDRRLGRSGRARRQSRRPAAAQAGQRPSCTGRPSATATARPISIVKSPEYTMPAVSQDQWWRPTVDIPGLTEPRWVRMVEIRPTNIQGRKILHHSIAHIVMDEADPDSINRGIASADAAAAPRTIERSA